MNSFFSPLQFLTGKGGVGKTTLAAALATYHAQQGKKVLLVDLDPHGPLPQLFNKKNLSYNPSPLADHIDGLTITPFDALKEYAGKQLKIQKIADLIIDNPVMHFFLDATPGIEEISIMGKIYYLSEEKSGRKKRWDIIIVDAPATGHGLYFFQSPKIFIDITQKGSLKTHVEEIYALFVSKKKTALHLVCLPEELPAQETLELFQSAKRLGLPLGKIIMNKMLPLVPTTSETAKGQTLSSLAFKIEETVKRYFSRTKTQATFSKWLAKETDTDILSFPWFLEGPLDYKSLPLFSQTVPWT